MPTYQYACTECDHAFEQVQSFSDASLTVCPQCQGRLRKVYNAVGVVFKGSGFYRTDSRSGSGSGAGSGTKRWLKSTRPIRSEWDRMSSRDGGGSMPVVRWSITTSPPARAAASAPARR